MYIQNAWSESFGNELISFYQESLLTPGYSDHEGVCAKKILQQMKDLNYDEAYIDSIGNVVGRVGSGPCIIHFDSHAKGGLSASVYAAALAKRAGLLDEKTVYVTASTYLQDCVGICLEHFYKESNVRPDFCIICEPSDNTIALGHTGKFQAKIKTRGISAHGSAPEKGINAVYEMAEIIQRAETLDKTLCERSGGGTIVLSDISCRSVSLNAVPSECEIHLDRRLLLGETIGQVRDELDELIAGKRARWEPGTLCRTSWNGARLVYNPVHEPWRIAESHPLTLTCSDTYEAVFGTRPSGYTFWDFVTNAAAPVSMNVAAIGFGPGKYKRASMKSECCSAENVKDACRFYAELIARL